MYYGGEINMTARVMRLDKTSLGPKLRDLRTAVLKRATDMWNQCGMTVRLFNFPVRR